MSIQKHSSSVDHTKEGFTRRSATRPININSKEFKAKYTKRTRKKTPTPNHKNIANLKSGTNKAKKVHSNPNKYLWECLASVDLIYINAIIDHRDENEKMLFLVDLRAIYIALARKGCYKT
jgi:hypothetical protein